MKNFDKKKLAALIVIVVLLILAIFGIVKLVQKNSGLTKEAEEKIEETITNYFTKLSIGYSSVYGGLDFVYDAKEAEYKNLNPGSVLELAIKYAETNDSDMAVNSAVYDFIKTEIGKEGVAYNAKAIQDAVKVLFGKDFELTDYFGGADFLYDYYYLEDYNAFVKVRNDVKDATSANTSMDFYVVSHKKNKDTVVSTIAVAYVYKSGSKYTYSKDKNGSKAIVENLDEIKFPTDKADEFNKYEITTKKVSDHYEFVSIKKVEK